MDLKHISRNITDGRDRAPARAMYKGIGFTDAAWDLYSGSALIGALRLGAMRMSGTAEIQPTKWKIFRMGLFGSVQERLKVGSGRSGARRLRVDRESKSKTEGDED